MIAKEEGFCFLTEVGGHFAGGGESVRVYIGEDGYWYLHGKSAQAVWAKAMSVQFSQKLAEAAVVPPVDADVQAWRELLATLAAGGDPAIKALAAKELAAGEPSEPAAMMELADAWNAATQQRDIAERRLAEAHVLRLYATAVGKMKGKPLAEARQRLNGLRLALAARQLNDLGAWDVRKGQWMTTTDGKIEGRGDSELALRHPLPGDCFLEFSANVVDGMRPRVLFPEFEMQLGNEGDYHQIEVQGAQTQRGVPLPYVNGQDLRLGIKFSGNQFEFFANGELMAKGTRRSTPSTMQLVLRGGDDSGPGKTRFWDFKVSAVE